MHKIPIIHIGYHKTGTTFFQESIYPFIKEYEYVNRSVVQDSLLKPSPYTFQSLIARETIEKSLRNGKKSLPPLICEEELSGNIHISGVNDFIPYIIARRIKKVFPEAKIIVSIREQISFILSSYLQYIKKGGTFKIEDYIGHNSFHGNKPWRWPSFQISHVLFHNLIKDYKKLFGNNNVVIFPYEILKKNPEYAVNWLLKQCELEKIEQFSKKPSNPSITPAIELVARQLNKFSLYDVPNKQTIMHIPGAFPLTRKLVTQLSRFSIFNNSSNFNRMYRRVNNIISSQGLYEHIVQSNKEVQRFTEFDLEKLGYPIKA